MSLDKCIITCIWLGAGGEGDDRGWDGWMASLTRWTWVWVNSRSWWWTGRPGMLRFMGSHRVGHDWTELNWTTLASCRIISWPEKFSVFFLFFPLPSSLWKPLIFLLFPWFCLFQIVIELESYGMYPFQIGYFHLVTSILDSSGTVLPSL